MHSLRKALLVFRHRKAVIPVLAAAVAAAVLIPVMLSIPDAKREAHFHSKLLEQAVRQELGLIENAPIPQARLGEITQLMICGNKVLQNWSVHEEEHDALKVDSTLWSGRGDVRDLSELEQFTNLEILVLDYQYISDVRPLQNKRFRYLSLCGNQITDVSALKDIDTLQRLWLEDNPVQDASVFRSLSSLNELVISGTNITEAESFCGLPLTTLKMRDTLIRDVTPLHRLNGLEVLTAGEVDEQGLETIQSMRTLTFLSVSGRMRDLEGFSGLPRLNMLDVSNSRLESLKGVEKLIRLDYIGFGYTSPDSLEPLVLNDSILTAEMVGADITDYTPLLRCKKLETVHVGFSREQEVKTQLEGSGLEIMAWEE